MPRTSSTSSTAKKTSSKSTAAKKTSTATKKPAAPKAPKPVVVETPVEVAESVSPETDAAMNDIIEAAKNAPPVEEVVAPVRKLKDKAAIIEKIKTDTRVRVRVPEDPRGEIKVWERHFNGHPVVLLAGRVYDLPQFIVDAIEKSMVLEHMSDKETEAFSREKSRYGKYLGEINRE